MVRAIVQVLLNAVGLLLADVLITGIHFRGEIPALLVAGLVIGLINLIVRPVVKILSCPLIVLTLGLFYLVINGLMLYLADLFLEDLVIDGFGAAVLGGLVLAVLNWVVRAFTPERKEA